jgi:HD-like signal output (HDOD) protein
MATAKQAPQNWLALREKLKSMLLERIEAGKLVLPAMPTTASKVLECLESGSHQDRIASLLEQDPVLALEVLRLANSASFAPRSRIESIAHAISMLGATRLRSLLVTASARQVFISRNRTIRELTGTLWTHSIGVATVARQIAVRAAFPDKEAPYMVGLMHDIGKPIVAIHLLDLERSVSRSVQDHWIDPTEWLKIVQEVHRPVGVEHVRGGLPSGARLRRVRSYRAQQRCQRRTLRQRARQTRGCVCGCGGHGAGRDRAVDRPLDARSG